MSQTADPLPDGGYDVLVVDASVDASIDESPGAGPSTVRIELVITAGPSKGETVAVRADLASHTHPLDLLGLPGRITVIGGRPAFTLDG